MINNIFKTLVVIFTLILFLSSFDKQDDRKNEVVILKLMGKKLESAYYIDDGEEKRVRGVTGDVALEKYLDEGWELIGTSVASDAGRFSVVYTLRRFADKDSFSFY